MECEGRLVQVVRSGVATGFFRFRAKMVFHHRGGERIKITFKCQISYGGPESLFLAGRTAEHPNMSTQLKGQQLFF